MAVLSGIDFFTVEVLTWRGLATYYVLFFIQLETRRVTLAGITRHPTAEWMLQMSRNATDEISGHLNGQRHLFHRDTKFCAAFRNVIRMAGVQPLMLPPNSPNLNAVCERLMGTVRRECLDFLIPLGERHLRRTLQLWIDHYNRGRPHMSLGPGISVPLQVPPQQREHRHQPPAGQVVRSRPVLGGLHHEYRLEKAAA
jgi:putative transposase